MIEFQNKERKFFYVSQKKRELEKLIEGFRKKSKEKEKRWEKEELGKDKELIIFNWKREREKKSKGLFKQREKMKQIMRKIDS